MSQLKPHGKFTRFFWTAQDQDLIPLIGTDFNSHTYFKQGNRQADFLNQFISNELGLSHTDPDEKKAKHVEYMRKHDLVDYCDVSEKGHMKWYPKGMMIRSLILEYARRLAREWGAFEMSNPILIRGDSNTVGQLMGEFHERNYKVDGGRGIGYLRYASDPLAFPFMQNVRFTKKQSPLKVYEEANCFRNEQDGEVSGLKRMRWFIMTDMHAACSDIEEGKREFETLCGKFGKLMNDIIAKERWILGWEIVEKDYHDNATWLKKISDSMGVPAFFKLMPKMSHYYAFKNEFQSINSDGSNIQVSTVQWDIKDGERFDIGYVGEDGKKHPCPVILHASSFGSIERTLCSILENIAIDEKEGKVPAYPLWLAPTQIRIAPVTDRHVEHASTFASYFNNAQIRTDLDDKSEGVGKKIRNAEKDWVPYIIVCGDREINSPILTVRDRTEQQTFEIEKEGLVSKIAAKTRNKPYLPLPLDVSLSKRPLFK